MTGPQEIAMDTACQQIDFFNGAIDVAASDVDCLEAAIIYPDISVWRPKHVPVQYRLPVSRWTEAND
jgi:hypothetical protein